MLSFRLKQPVLEWVGEIVSDSIVSEISITPIYYMKYTFKILFIRLYYYILYFYITLVI